MTNCQGGGWAGEGGEVQCPFFDTRGYFLRSKLVVPMQNTLDSRAVTSLEISFCTERHIHPQLSTIFDKTNVVVSSTCGPTRLTVQSDLSPRARPVSHSCFDDGAGLMRRRNMV